jgi:hypothetical protein
MIMKDVEIFRSKGFQNVPKLGVSFENKPSGNPEEDHKSWQLLQRSIIAQSGLSLVRIFFFFCKNAFFIIRTQKLKKGLLAMRCKMDKREIW